MSQYARLDEYELKVTSARIKVGAAALALGAARRQTEARRAAHLR
jgi:hypothetical protein